MEEIVKEYFRLVNEDKFEALFSLFDPQVAFHGSFGFKADNLEDVKPFYLEIPVHYTEHVDTPVDIFVSGNKVAAYIDFVGKTKKGKTIAFKAMDRFVIEDGKIKALSIFFDTFILHKQFTQSP